MHIDSIQNGIVIDHISAGKAMKLYNLLRLDKLDCPVAMIMNVVSKKSGKKDIIKVDADIPIDLDVIGYVDPGVTVNFIKDGKLVDKRKLDLPEVLTDVIKCKNPRCITSCEQEIKHIFRLRDREHKIYRCAYCESKAKI